jgi:hypothetical protein
MKLHEDDKTTYARQSKEEIEKGADLVDEMFTTTLEKGDDEFYEAFSRNDNKAKNIGNAETQKIRRGRRM